MSDLSSSSLTPSQPALEASDAPITPDPDPLPPAPGSATTLPVVQENGQRRVGPPAEWVGVPPGRGCEVFVGKVPRDCDERELLPVLGRAGRVYELRIMVDFSGTNRGYCFATFSRREEARRAIRELNNYEIRKGRHIGVCGSVDNCRLFVGGLPRSKQQAEVAAELRRVTTDVIDVIVYADARDKTRNRGFAFVEYASHRAAALARRTLLAAALQPWGQPLAIDWAEPELDVDEDVMAKVKILYIRNLMLSTEESTLERLCCAVLAPISGSTRGLGGADEVGGARGIGGVDGTGGARGTGGAEGPVERVKKIRDYAFVHFRERTDALTVMSALNGTEIEGSIVEIVLAKPVDKATYVRRSHDETKTSLAQVMSYTAALAAAGASQGLVSGACSQGLATGVLGGGTTTGPGLLLTTGLSTRELTSGGRNPLVMGPRDLAGGSALKGGRARGAGGVGRVYAQARLPYKKGTHLEAVRAMGPCLMSAGGGLHAGGLLLTHPYLPPHLLSAPLPLKSATLLLEEVSVASGWGVPAYHLFSTPPGSASTELAPLYLAKLTVPGLQGAVFSAGRLCASVDEAREGAAQALLTQLGVISVQDTFSAPLLPTSYFSAAPPLTSTYQGGLGALPPPSQIMLTAPQGSLVPPQAPPQGAPLGSELTAFTTCLPPFMTSGPLLLLSAGPGGGLGAGPGVGDTGVGGGIGMGAGGMGAGGAGVGGKCGATHFSPFSGFSYSGAQYGALPAQYQPF